MTDETKRVVIGRLRRRNRKLLRKVQAAHWLMDQLIAKPDAASVEYELRAIEVAGALYDRMNERIREELGPLAPGWRVDYRTREVWTEKSE